MEWSVFKRFVSEAFKYLPRTVKAEISDTEIKLIIDEQSIGYSINDFQRDSGNCDCAIDGYCLSGSDYYEVLLEEPNRSRLGMRNQRSIELNIIDNERSVTYSIGRISSLYVLALICSGKMESASFRIIPLYLNLNRELGSLTTIMDILISGLRIQSTLKITSTKEYSLAEFVKYGNSLLFAIAYNTGRVFTVPQVIETYNDINISKNAARRSNFKDLEAPKLLYNEDLTCQYFKAMSSTDPFIAFLCFYHVIENFSEEVYIEDIIANIRKEIQHPKFSSRRAKDIMKIVDIVRTRLRRNTEEYSLDEQEALGLTLRKYIPDPIDLISAIDAIDSSSVSYYRTTTVPFSKGDSIDLHSTPIDKLYSKLAARIYKTRNAIVHSKSNEHRTKDRNIYKPMNDEPDLEKELPLMRAISEQIIIATADGK